jgi:hypothetical protein
MRERERDGENDLNTKRTRGENGKNRKEVRSMGESIDGRPNVPSDGPTLPRPT